MFHSFNIHVEEKTLMFGLNSFSSVTSRLKEKNINLSLPSFHQFQATCIKVFGGGCCFLFFFMMQSFNTCWGLLPWLLYALGTC